LMILHWEVLLERYPAALLEAGRTLCLIVMLSSSHNWGRQGEMTKRRSKRWHSDTRRESRLDLLEHEPVGQGRRRIVAVKARSKQAQGCFRAVVSFLRPWYAVIAFPSRDRTCPGVMVTGRKTAGKSRLALCRASSPPLLVKCNTEVRHDSNCRCAYSGFLNGNWLSHDNQSSSILRLFSELEAA
jgi:hypothetical protein